MQRLDVHSMADRSHLISLSRGSLLLRRDAYSYTYTIVMARQVHSADIQISQCQ